MSDCALELDETIMLRGVRVTYRGRNFKVRTAKQLKTIRNYYHAMRDHYLMEHPDYWKPLLKLKVRYPQNYEVGLDDSKEPKLLSATALLLCAPPDSGCCGCLYYQDRKNNHRKGPESQIAKELRIAISHHMPSPP